MDDPQHSEEAVRRNGRMPLVLAAVVALMIGALAFAACEDDESGDGDGDATATTESNLSGDINGDGSSTVFPITEAVAEEFGKANPNVRVTAGIAGTGGGFTKFCNGETDFNDASRPIKDEEAQACAANGIEYVEFQVAYDGLSVVTNPANDFVDCLTVGELKTIWEPAADGTVTNWSQVRAGFPDKALALYGPGTDSGTFDFFTEEINGETDASRADYTASEDDNTLVEGVAGDEGGLGYFGLSYYEANTDRLKLLGVDNGSGCVTPSATTVLDGTYAPLSRPLFVYFEKEALARPEGQAFMVFYLTDGPALVDEVGYVRAPDDVYEAGLAKIDTTSSPAATATP